MEPRTSFVGRDAEIADVCRLVRSTQLVTLVGPGGVGKTRLAHRVADALATEATDGIHFAELAPLPADTSETAVGDAVAEVVGASDLESAWTSLDDATTLIVLDNAEHVLDAVASIAERLLIDRPQLRLLLTSREPLETPGEQVVVVQPLDLESARELLRQRAVDAGVAGPGVEVAANESLGRLDDALDGLPLAIELAAPRLRSLSSEELRAELADSNELLTRGRGDIRHRSLANLVAWSYDRLGPAEAVAFRHACVFPAGFGIDDLAAVTDEHIERHALADCLDRLVAQSLLRAERHADGTRFRMLVPIRQAARAWAEHEGELDLARERAIDHLTATASSIIVRGGAGWSDDLTEETIRRSADFRAAGDWCVGHDASPDRAFVLFLPMWATVHHSHIEGTLRHGERLLDRWPDPEATWWPEVAAVTATAAVAMGDLEAATTYAAMAIGAESEPTVGAAVALRALALCHMVNGEFETAAATAARGAEAARTVGWPSLASHLDNHRANALLQAGDVETARSIVIATDAGAREEGTSALRGPALQVLAESHVDDDPATGHRVLDTLPEAVGPAELVAGRWASRRVRGELFLRQGAVTEALAALRDSIRAAKRVGERRDQWHALQWAAIALALHHDDHRELAATILAAARRCAAAPALGAVGRDLIDEAISVAGPEPAVVPSDAAVMSTALAAIDELLDRGEDQPHVVTITARPRLAIGGRDTTIEWQGVAADLPTVKGLIDIAAMVATPSTDFHALSLMGSTFDESGTGPTIDDQARRAYEDRLRALQADIAEAEDTNDLGRLDVAQREFDEIVETLSAALGLGGRDRAPNASAEKARSAVTWRIRAAIKRVEAALPSAGRHLRASIKTGAFCRYEPEADPGWIVET